MTTQDHVRLHATVEGRVQGVNFRYFVSENANRLGLSGWVRNRWRGTVEVLAEGERKSLDELLAALHRGPRSANVSGVQFEWQQATSEFTSFRIRMTA